MFTEIDTIASKEAEAIGRSFKTKTKTYRKPHHQRRLRTDLHRSAVDDLQAEIIRAEDAGQTRRAKLLREALDNYDRV